MEIVGSIVGIQWRHFCMFLGTVWLRSGSKHGAKNMSLEND